MSPYAQYSTISRNAHSFHSQKYQKIRKRDATIYGMEDALDVNSTPRGPRSGVSTSKSTGKRGRGAKEFDDGADDDEASESPTKKIKAAKAELSGLPSAGRSFAPIKPERASEYADSEATTVRRDTDEKFDGGDGGEMEHHHIGRYGGYDEA